MKFDMTAKKSSTKGKYVRALGAALISLPLVAGCVQQRVFNNGPQITQDQLDLIPVGSSQEQVLLALGSPSTTGQFDTEVFYYISQKRAKRYEFQRMTLIDQRVLSVYFDENKQVSRIADFGLKDGKVFDFISRTTPTTGKDFTFLRQILTGKASPATVLQGTQRSTGAPSAPGVPN
jgi:outer membrane protein assembly factor BamE (lipoprotein component of BamABCDE complex)